MLLVQIMACMPSKNFRLMFTCGGPVKVCVCLGYGNLYLAKRAELGYMIRISLPENKWYSSVQNNPKRMHKNAVSLSSFYTHP